MDSDFNSWSSCLFAPFRLGLQSQRAVPSGWSQVFTRLSKSKSLYSKCWEEVNAILFTFCSWIVKAHWLSRQRWLPYAVPTTLLRQGSWVGHLIPTPKLLNRPKSQGVDLKIHTGCKDVDKSNFWLGKPKDEKSVLTSPNCFFTATGGFKCPGSQYMSIGCLPHGHITLALDRECRTPSCEVHLPWWATDVL